MAPEAGTLSGQQFTWGLIVAHFSGRLRAVWRGKGRGVGSLHPQGNAGVWGMSPSFKGLSVPAAQVQLMGETHTHTHIHVCVYIYVHLCIYIWQ